MSLRAGGSSQAYCRPTRSRRISRSKARKGIPPRRRKLFFLRREDLIEQPHLGALESQGGEGAGNAIDAVVQALQGQSKGHQAGQHAGAAPTESHQNKDWNVCDAQDSEESLRLGLLASCDDSGSCWSAPICPSGRAGWHRLHPEGH